MLLGIVLHAALPYMPSAEGYWPTDGSSSRLIDIIFQFIHIWRMPLFFILAGFFANLTISKKSWKYWWTNRCLRIGLPLLVFTPLLSLTLPTIFSYGKTGELVFFYSTDGRPYHLWFLWHLLFFAAFTVISGPSYLLGSRIFHRLTGRSFGSLKHLLDRAFRTLFRVFLKSRIPVPLMILCFFLSIPTGGDLITNPVITGLYFILGYSLFTNRFLLSFIKSYWYYYLLSAIAVFGVYITSFFPFITDLFQELFPGLMAIPEGADNSLFKDLLYMSRISAAILFSYAFIGLFEVKYNSYNAALRFISDGSYWMYIVHLPVVSFLTFSMFNLNIFPEMKFLIAIVTTSTICLITYKYLVRSTLLGLILNGKRQHFGPG